MDTNSPLQNWKQHLNLRQNPIFFTQHAYSIVKDLKYRFFLFFRVEVLGLKGHSISLALTFRKSKNDTGVKRLRNYKSNDLLHLRLGCLLDLTFLFLVKNFSKVHITFDHRDSLRKVLLFEVAFLVDNKEDPVAS